MDTYQGLLTLLQLLTLGGVVSAASTSPFRGELSAVPRGLDVLLGNVAPRPASPARKPRGAGNGLGVSLAPGKLSSSYSMWHCQLLPANCMISLLSALVSLVLSTAALILTMSSLHVVINNFAVVFQLK